MKTTFSFPSFPSCTWERFCQRSFAAAFPSANPVNLVNPVKISQKFPRGFQMGCV
jgi:hypothetical protein